MDSGPFGAASVTWRVHGSPTIALVGRMGRALGARTREVAVAARRGTRLNM